MTRESAPAAQRRKTGGTYSGTRGRRPSLLLGIGAAAAGVLAGCSSANGAASPGRWHCTHLAKTIGAMCLLKVTRCANGFAAPHDAADATALPHSATTTAVFARNNRDRCRTLSQLKRL